ncbi:hypothetical protein ACA910_013562 [Epithemia clementina (nom. ined.)]
MVIQRRARSAALLASRSAIWHYYYFLLVGSWLIHSTSVVTCFPVVGLRKKVEASFFPLLQQHLQFLASNTAGRFPSHHQRRFWSALFASPQSEEPHVQAILFVECGFGADAHGQNPTKAAVRACRNAIEFNQIPSIVTLVPGGQDEMKLDVLLAVPAKYQSDLDLAPVRQAFPYGKIRIQIQDGGMVASNGKIIESLGDANEDMVIVCCAVTVGY